MSNGDARLIIVRINQSEHGSEYSHDGHSLHVDGQVNWSLSRFIPSHVSWTDAQLSTSSLMIILRQK
jgi:hypothetical protein